MSSIKRRDFLWLITALPLAGSLTALAGERSANSYPASELYAALTVWQQQHLTAPSTYLRQRGICFTDQAGIRQHVEDDFRRKQTLRVKGIVLSETEVAILSAMALAVLS